MVTFAFSYQSTFNQVQSHFPHDYRNMIELCIYHNANSVLLRLASCVFKLAYNQKLIKKILPNLIQLWRGC